MIEEDDYKLNDNVEERRGRGGSVIKSTSHLTIFLKSISHMGQILQDGKKVL